MGVKFRRKMSKMGYKKSRRFVIFSVGFYRFWTKKWAIGIYRKTGPTKSTVLGPGPPPPGKFIKFIDFYRFFGFWGPSREPEKASAKSASTPYPPKMIILCVFINSRPNFVAITIESPRRNILTYTEEIVFLRMFCNLSSCHLLGSSSSYITSSQKNERIAKDNS
jgi:hypothetical protein